ncbi:uncharacterized protein LOC128961723 [Oppia nitens]|uniref:uncharacterized protein LOC128961723 n=1 Tax=Oppia nitens TaxID=1686743 RepID=UPI0023DA56E0|nr:uncharacterized protein LOC128961723 [Oppia nitens]
MNFISSFKDKFNRIFVKKLTANEDDVRQSLSSSLSTSVSLNSETSDDFKECERVVDDSQVVVEDDNNRNDNTIIVKKQCLWADTVDDNQLLNEDYDIKITENWQPRVRNDWYDLQIMDSDSSCSSPKMAPNNRSKKAWNKNKDVNRLLEKWGESVGIFDRITGSQKRLVQLKDLHNYFEVKLSSLNSSDCLLLCSLINDRYPRFYTSTVNYYQRWRMRYNLFVASDTMIQTGERKETPISAGDSVSNIDGRQLVLHIGEIHLYFDIVPKYCQPVYVNSSFYANKLPINDLTGVFINEMVMNRITRIVNSIRYSKDIFQFKFPLSEDMFHHKNHLFHKFLERQMEFIDESVKVFRKSEQKKRDHNWNQRQTKQSASSGSRFEVRDHFGFDYDIKHKMSNIDLTCGNVGSVSGIDSVNKSGNSGRRNRGRKAKSSSAAITATNAMNYQFKSNNSLNNTGH